MAKKEDESIQIDGSFGEGGGQILRTSLALSAITGIPVKIFNIRAKREKGGLQPQHLMSCMAVNQISNGVLEGAEIGSYELHFKPGKIQEGSYCFDVRTAGSTTLVAQTVIPILLSAQGLSEVQIIGGTHLPKSPSYDFFEKIFIPAVSRFGLRIHSKMERSGYYPAGGGSIRIKIVPSYLYANTNWQREGAICGIVRVSRLPRHIAEREEKVLRENGVDQVNIIEESAYSPANSLTLWQGFRGVSVLGERRKRAEIVAEEAVFSFLKEREEVDTHLADQLLIYGALSKGRTSYHTSAITSHLTTNAIVIQRFLKRNIRIEGNTVEID